MKIMVIAAHPGDEVLGCGGTIARHAAEGDEVHLLFVADGETARAMKALPNRNFMALEASKVLGAKPPRFIDFTDDKLDTVPMSDVVGFIGEHVDAVRPQIVYTHHKGEYDVDDHIVHQAAMTVLLPIPGCGTTHIYAFEAVLPTQWGTGFSPNHYVDITAHARAKRTAMDCYKSEVPGLEKVSQYRGLLVGCPNAEAFMTLRSIR